MSFPRPDVQLTQPATAGWRPPSRRLPVRALNLAGSTLRRTGLAELSFDPEALLASAVKAGGSDDFGSAEFHDPLAALAESFERDADLHFLGRLWARGHVVAALTNRLRMQQDWKRHPEILDEDVRAPIVVVGLPRSGTTLLQGLLGADRSHRSLLHWEASNPSPPPEAATRATDPRIARAERAFRLVYWMAPEGRAMHALGPSSPTECLVLLGNSLASVEFPCNYHVPRHLEWFLGADLRPHYAYHRRQLQQLQWRCGPRQWVLKSPAHLFALDALLATYPDARIVHIHRDPAVVMGSFCSLTATMHSLASEHADGLVIASTWAPLWAEALERATATRAVVPARQFVDVYYRDLLADPVGCVQRIYEHFGLTFDETVADSVGAHLDAHPQGKHGVHRYALADFGLDQRRERERFAAYRERFAVPLEPA